ncbi:hypothetical protein AAG593_13345 [Citromicrobium bathyomarinum]
MKVMVIGSYRPQEGQRGLVRDAGKRFKKTAFILGKGLAEHGHDLVLGWSYNNVPSQLGVKTQDGVWVTQHAKSHPYWETADFHALRGFLSVLRHDPVAPRRKRVFLECVGRSDDVPNAPPFPLPSVLDGLSAAPQERYRVEFGEARASAFNPTEAINLRDPANAVFVDIRRAGDVRTTAMRQELLLNLVKRVDAIITLGGGKATEAEIERCDPQKLLIPAIFSEDGGFSDEENALRSRQSPKLQALWTEIAARSGETSEMLAYYTGSHLKQLLAAARRDGVAIPFQTRAFQLAALIVAAMLVFTCFAVWEAATAKNASLALTIGLLLFGPALFSVLIWVEFQLLFKNPRNSRQIFFGVIAAGILSVGPTLGLLTDGLGLIPPRAAVADETLPVDAEHK